VQKQHYVRVSDHVLSTSNASYLFIAIVDNMLLNHLHYPTRSATIE